LLCITDNVIRQARLGGQFYFRSVPKDCWCHASIPSHRRSGFSSSGVDWSIRSPQQPVQGPDPWLFQRRSLATN
jgi:hypothetical protein